MSSPNRYRRRRDQNEPAIVEALTAIGCDVFRLDAPCDLLVGYRGRNMLIEIKRPKVGKVTPAQAKWNAQWRGQRATVKTVDEAIESVTLTPAMRSIEITTFADAEPRFIDVPETT